MQQVQLMKNISVFCATILTLWFASSCEESGDLTIIDDPVFEFFFIDTVSLDLSTVHVDSMITQGASSIMMGQYTDPLLGKIAIRSFLQFSLGGELELNEEDVFDSLGLIIYPYRETYGSGPDQRINVYRINESYEPEGDVFYQFDKLSFDNHPVGSFLLEEEEDATDSIFIKLDASLGQQIFQMAVDGDDALDTDEDFREYLGGFVFVSEDPEANFINSITFDQQNIKLKLYYRRPADDDVNELDYDFLPGEAANHFNQVLATTTGSLLDQIIDQKEMDSDLTGGMAFIQGSSSLVTKINIPFIQNIEAAFENALINSAILEVVPVDKSFSTETPLPDQLSLVYIDKFNNIDDALQSPTEGIVATGDLTHDEELGQETHYEIDVTNFLEDMVLNGADNNESFYVALPLDDINSDIRTLTIDASRFKTKLKIYLSKYNE